MQKRKLEEKDVNKLDFTKFELDYILKYANFTNEETQIFKLLTSKNGRESIVCISSKLNLGTATVSRRIKKIKNKIMKLI